MFRGRLTLQGSDGKDEVISAVAKVSRTGADSERTASLLHEAQMYMGPLQQVQDCVPEFLGIYCGEEFSVLLLSDCGTALKAWPLFTMDNEDFR